MSENNNDDIKTTILKDEEAILLDHDYDGIKELDNHLPNWWLATFYGTIIFSFIYVIHYWTGAGPNHQVELEMQMAEIQSRQDKQQQVAAAAAPKNLEELLSDPAHVLNGQTVYASKCAACHGIKGEGGIGPNLTDHHWIHGDGKVNTISDVIRDGVAAKGMPPWGPVLKPTELADVTVFVRSIVGSNPANAKAPEGQKFE